MARILIAEDEDALRALITRALSDSGHEVVTATDGQQAMNLLVGGLVPSLLIVDIGMPNVGGEELLKYVQSDPDLRHIPVLVVTGTPERIGRTVADAIIEKPVNVISLVSHVQRLTSVRRRPRPELTSGH